MIILYSRYNICVYRRLQWTSYIVDTNWQISPTRYSSQMMTTTLISNWQISPTRYSSQMMTLILISNWQISPTRYSSQMMTLISNWQISPTRYSSQMMTTTLISNWQISPTRYSSQMMTLISNWQISPTRYSSQMMTLISNSQISPTRYSSQMMTLISNWQISPTRYSSQMVTLISNWQISPTRYSSQMMTTTLISKSHLEMGMVGLECLMPFSTIFQLYRGEKWNTRRFEFATSVVIGINCIHVGSCKFNYHTITRQPPGGIGFTVIFRFTVQYKLSKIFTCTNHCKINKIFLYSYSIVTVSVMIEYLY
jgi:ribosome-associated toxin RatA of RatAB toxin-antitoxin module